MRVVVDKGKSIEELEGYCWLAPDFRSTVVLKTYALRRKPLAELTLDNFRTSPFADGLYYPGVIVLALLEIPRDFWVSHDELRKRLERVYDRMSQLGDSQDDFWRANILLDLKEAYARFRGD